MQAQQTEKQDSLLQRTVSTPLGDGKIVYELPDGSLVVEFAWGGGHIFPASELLRGRVNRYGTANLYGQISL